MVFMQKAFTVTYTVREHGSVPPVAFDPTQGVWAFSEGTEEQGHEDFWLVAQSGTREFVDAVYFSSPPGTEGHPQVNDWISADGMPSNSYGSPRASGAALPGTWAGNVARGQRRPAAGLLLPSWPADRPRVRPRNGCRWP